MNEIWFLANLVTAICYFVIPYEIWMISRHVRGAGLHRLTLLFVTFISACGLHHAVMLQFYGHHPVNSTMVLTDSAMATVSFAAAIILNRLRPRVVEVLLHLVTK